MGGVGYPKPAGAHENILTPTPTRYLWLHYGQYVERYTPAAVARLEGIFVMSKFDLDPDLDQIHH
jgi:hypothetical protein